MVASELESSSPGTTDNEKRHRDASRALLLLVVVLGVVLVVLVPVAAYVGLLYFRPTVGSPYEKITSPPPDAELRRGDASPDAE